MRFVVPMRSVCAAGLGGKVVAGTPRDSPYALDALDDRDEDVARLSPFVRHHVNMLGRCSSQLPDLPGGLRSLRAPDDDEG